MFRRAELIMGNPQNVGPPSAFIKTLNKYNQSVIKLYLSEIFIYRNTPNSILLRNMTLKV